MMIMLRVVALTILLATTLVSGQCVDDSECTSSTWCRASECVPFMNIGQKCGGSVGPMYQERCTDGLICLKDTSNGMLVGGFGQCVLEECESSSDCPKFAACNKEGECVSLVATGLPCDSAPCVSGNVCRDGICQEDPCNLMDCMHGCKNGQCVELDLASCESTKECPDTHWCRQTEEEGEKVCVPYASVGEECGGHRMVSTVEACGKGLQCLTDQSYGLIADVSGVCAPEMCEEDVECPEFAFCTASGSCQSFAGEGAKCKSDSIKCRPDLDCDSEGLCAVVDKCTMMRCAYGCKDSTCLPAPVQGTPFGGACEAQNDCAEGLICTRSDGDPNEKICDSCGVFTLCGEELCGDYDAYLKNEDTKTKIFCAMDAPFVPTDQLCVKQEPLPGTNEPICQFQTKEPTADLCAKNSCSEKETCVPEPKMCIAETDCIQYTCIPNDDEDEPQCPSFMSYKECGTACASTCETKDTPQICAAVCVSGCFCNEGYVLDSNGRCIAEKECPDNKNQGEEEEEKRTCLVWYDGCNTCTRNSLADPFGCTRRACETNNEPECRQQDPCLTVKCDVGETCVASFKQCQQEPCPQYECKINAFEEEKQECLTWVSGCTTCERKSLEEEFQCVATCDQLDAPEPYCARLDPCLNAECGHGEQCEHDFKECITTPCDQFKCTPTTSCPAGMVYKSCGSACPVTCDNKDEEIMCAEVCKEGCFCEEGKAMNDMGECILISDCEKEPSIPTRNYCLDNDCGIDEQCVPEPKNCFTTPCPQYRCEATTVPCAESSVLMIDGQSINCGRGGQACPANSACDIHPADKWAVCCVPQNEVTTEATKAPTTTDGTKTTEIPTNCVQFFDGCNTCYIDSPGRMACTEMACLTMQPAKCLKFSDGTSPSSTATIGTTTTTTSPPEDVDFEGSNSASGTLSRDKEDNDGDKKHLVYIIVGAGVALVALIAAVAVVIARRRGAVASQSGAQPSFSNPIYTGRTPVLPIYEDVENDGYMEVGDINV